MALRDSDISQWTQAKRLLCIRLDALGDLLMTTPALRALKLAKPGRRLTVLTSSGAALAANLIPEIDEVIRYDAPWVKACATRENSRADRQMIKTLKRMRFDGAVIFTVFSQNPLPAAALAYYADIPLRLAHCRENPYRLLTNWIKDNEPESGIRHEVRRQLDLVAHLGCRHESNLLSLKVPSESRRRIREILRACRFDISRPWYVMHPGASAPSRRYPPESFAEAAALLYRLGGYRAVVTGSKSERELAAEVILRSETPALSLAGALTLAELAALIETAPLLISNNTGPVHVASALATPVVDVYALTNPQHTPWRTPHRVLSYDVPCRNCFKSICPEKHHACLRMIRPAEVATAALELLAECRQQTLNTLNEGALDVDAGN